MAININFDLVNNPEPLTILLAVRNGDILGQLKVNNDSVNVKGKFIDASEFSFTINKYVNDEVSHLWDKIVNFKLIHCKEWDMWFEIKVETDENDETVKTVFCTQLGHAELSQINIYDTEINTEKDIERDDYKISILYDANDSKSSILNRLLEKAPHYYIAHVDPTIAKIQRSFSFDGTSIYDAFQEIAEEIGCLFVFPSNSNDNGKINRAIYVYDLQQNCNNCGYRGEFVGKCPKCNSTNIINGYGEDTLIFVTSDELASSGIGLTTDVDAVKNCFRLEAGDDLMTATIRNCNPNGTNYIWYLSDNVKEDMSDELVNRLKSYDELYDFYYNSYSPDINLELLEKYNVLIDKYSVYNKDLERIEPKVIGYSSLMNACYNTIDLALFLKSGLMPNIEISETNAEEQAILLTSSSISPVAVADEKIASLATINSAVLAMAKIIVKPTYKVQVNTSELIVSGDNKQWRGNFTITNYSDEEDAVTSQTITIDVNDDLETFIKQKIEKALNKDNTDDMSISGLFKKEHDDFCKELKKYALNPLISFRDSCQACIDILIEQGVGTDSTWSDIEEGSEGNLHEKLYIPYYDKLKAIEAEIKIRENEISIISGAYDIDGNLITEGLQTNIENCRNIIQNALDFEKYLGTELWLEFCAYRREDKYQNENYISDGLNNAELFKKALEFFEVAENEIYKSAELQHSISTTLNNLLAIPKFESLIQSFEVGNWIRVQVDDEIYKLRLLEYEIDYGDFDNISVEFSDITRINNGTTNVRDILSQAKSMATSYSSVKKQANQGEKSNNILSNWVQSGLNATNTKIIGANNQNQIWDKNGILCRQYDPITDSYSDEQLKIINSTIAITDDNWKTTKTAIGKCYYVDPHTKELKCVHGVNGEVIVGKLLVGEQLDIANDNGTLQFGVDGFVVKNDINIVAINPSNESIFNISNDSGNIFSLNNEGKLVIVGDITASSLTLLDGTSIGTDKITGLSDVAISGEYSDLNNIPKFALVATSGEYGDLSNVPTKLSQFTNDSAYITKGVNDLTNYYKKTDTDNLLNAKASVDSLEAIATSGLLSDAKDIDELKNWILEQIQLAVNQQTDNT